jgi:pimeloyl-ACP methyl ester carboxylesterase
VSGHGGPTIIETSEEVVARDRWDAIKNFPATLPGLVSAHILDGGGHWVQQERPDEVNRLLTTWLHSLD